MEDKNEYRLKKDTEREKFMTEDEMKEVNDLINDLNSNRSNMNDLYTEWSDIEEAYLAEQPEVKNMPNSRINRFHANIEGQVTTLVEQNIAVVCRGGGPSDVGYARWAQIGLDWTFRKNKIRTILTVHERRRKLFGNGIFKMVFNPNAINGFGLVEIVPTPLNKFFVDKKIKDFLRFNEAEYQAETITYSGQQMEDMYGEEKAGILDYGRGTDYRDNGVFNEMRTLDDDNSTVVIQVWSRQNGKLRRRDISGCGILLWDSHKTGGKKSNQKNSDKNIKSYNKYTNDRYPYFFTILYPVEGQLHGFGDGKLLLPLQNLLNELYDKIRICARPNIIGYDPDMCEADLSKFDENSLEPRPMNLSSGNEPIISIPWNQVHPDWWSLLKFIEEEIQHVSRFSALMLGSSGKKEQTATESSIQQQQGYNSIDHQKVLLQETLVEMCNFALGLMMENYTGGKAFRLDEEKDDYEWIDFRKMTNVPVMKPAEESYVNQFNEANPDVENPKWEIVKDTNGKPLTKSVDLDIEINIGAGLPKNKVFLYQMIERLAPLSVGGMPVIEWTEFRGLLKDWLGLPLTDNQEAQLKLQVEMMQQAQIEARKKQPANIQQEMTNNPSGGIPQQSEAMG